MAVGVLMLTALPFAALLVATRPGSWSGWLAAALAGGVGSVLLLLPERGVLDGVIRAWIVLVSVAFALSARFRPGSFWPLALRACLYAAAAVAVLAPAAAGSGVWREVQWEATRDASRSVRFVVEVAPALYPAFEPMVRLVAAGWAVWLVLTTLAGLALAWRGHSLVARSVLNR